MKLKILIKSALIALVATTATLTTVKAGDVKSDKMADCVMMKDGKMMMMKDGKCTAMVTDMTCTNGTKVTTDGHIMMQDGQKMMMKDGGTVNTDGTVMTPSVKKSTGAQ
jgi:hypothetical protein